MSAPVLLLLAQSADVGTQGCTSEMMRTAIATARPDLDVRVAHRDNCLPSVAQTVQRIVHDGYEEVIVIGLGLTEPSDDSHAPSAIAQRISLQYPNLGLAAGRPITPDSSLLRVVDAKLRQALSDARATDLDGLVLAAAHAGDERANSQLARIARQWGHHHKLGVSIAYESVPGRGVASAVRALRAQGKRHIAVGSWFIASGATWRRTQAAALAEGAIAVSEPVGAVEEAVRLLLARYAFAAMDLLSVASGPTLAETVPLHPAIRSEPPHLRVASA